MDVWACRNKYFIRVFFVNNNRVKETLLPIVIKNVYTYPTILNSNEGENEDYPATTIYSDCFQTYQKEDFNPKGYYCTKLTIQYGLVKEPFIQTLLKVFGVV